MRLEPPQPPTAPAPAMRPTPPTPPRIDKSPFAKESADVDKPAQESADTDKPADDAPQLQREVETPETMARDAVAHGSGALTKRTVDKPQAEPKAASEPAPRQETAPANTQSEYDRGQDVLREFKALDARDAQPTENFPAHTSAEQPKPAVPKLRYDEGHGAFYWVFTIVFLAVAAFVVARKFLFTDKPALTASELFDDSSSRQKSAAEKVKPVVKPTEKPVPTKKSTPAPRAEKPKKDADKVKHFEVRV